jgi:hypothetical protein
MGISKKKKVIGLKPIIGGHFFNPDLQVGAIQMHWV